MPRVRRAGRRRRLFSHHRQFSGSLDPVWQIDEVHLLASDHRLNARATRIPILHLVSLAFDQRFSQQHIYILFERLLDGGKYLAEAAPLLPQDMHGRLSRPQCVVLLLLPCRLVVKIR